MVYPATFVTCSKINVSVVIFASCAVAHDGVSNTPSHADSRERSAVGFGARSADVHALCVYLYCITF